MTKQMIVAMIPLTNEFFSAIRTVASENKIRQLSNENSAVPKSNALLFKKVRTTIIRSGNPTKTLIHTR